MAFLPSLNTEHSSTRDKIISILANSPGQNTKQINNTLKKQYSINVTYQAVHKTLKQMIEEGILAYSGKEYIINQEWIKQIRAFTSKLATSQTEEGFSEAFNYDELINTKETRKIVLKTRDEFDSFYYNIRKKLTQNLETLPVEDRIIFRNFWHLYYPLVHPKEEKELLDLVKKVDAKSYTFVIGDTPLDQWSSKIYKDTPDKVLLGEVIASTNMIFIYGNVLMDVYYDYKIVELFDSIFNSIKNVDSLNLDTAVNHIYTVNEPIYITINTDPIIVNTLKKLFLYKLSKNNLLPPSSDHMAEFNEIFKSNLLKETIKHEFKNEKIEIINRNSNSYIIKKEKESGNEVKRIILLPPKGFTSNGVDLLNCHPEARFATLLFKGGIKKENNGYIKLKDGLKYCFYLTKKATRIDDYSEAKIDYDDDLYREELKSSNENFYVVNEDGEGFYHNLINLTDTWEVLIVKKSLAERKPLNTEKFLAAFSEKERSVLKRFIDLLPKEGDKLFYSEPKLLAEITQMDIDKILPFLIDTLNIPETGKHEQCSVFAMVLKISKTRPNDALSILKASLNKNAGQSYYLNELILKVKKHIENSEIR